MKTATRLFILLTFSFFINSCATHSGMMTGNAALSDANFKVVDYAIGRSETFKFLGMGGVPVDGIVMEAKRNLYDNYPLKSGQALANVTVDFKRSYFVLIFGLKVTVTADVIDFNEGAKVVAEPDEFPLEFSHLEEKNFSISREYVYFEKNEFFLKGKVVDFNNGKANIMMHNRKDQVVLRKVKLEKLFFLNEIEGLIETGFKVGDKVIYKEYIIEEYQNVAIAKFGTIIALGQNEAIIEIEKEGKNSKVLMKYDLLVPHE